MSFAPETFDTPGYDDYFKKYTFELSGWQKQSIKAIVDGNHSLVTAPTGSGKTLPAEFAIEYFAAAKKKVIYTSPIKALSNQKYHEFTKKFPHISFGILTGDIKDNPEADVLIMTTEILRNNLYGQTLDITRENSQALDFNVNIESDVGGIIFDEVHYINDPCRGTVWEECFMLIPKNVQLLMLSATIHDPKGFGEWVSEIHNCKDVIISSTKTRAVPLEHHIWFSCNDSTIKKMTDKKMKDLFEKNNRKSMVIQSSTGKYNSNTYALFKKMKAHLDKTKVYVNKSFVLNQIVNHLHILDFLPAICFVYSRKNVEKYASEITRVLLPDAQMANFIERECLNTLRKLPNYKEYLHLPEYHFIKKLLEKGIGIHHSGILPVFREMIEILFGKGYVRLLFATETFSVGLNMPTKAVVFTDIHKYDGNSKRLLHSHEYTQQAGRAGRRGYDCVGHVFHLCNMYEFPDEPDYVNMLANNPQKLRSKFKISFGLILNLYASERSVSSFEDFTKSSMISLDIKKVIINLTDELSEIQKDENDMYAGFNKLSTPFSIIKRGHTIQKERGFANNKVRKAMDAEYKGLKEKSPSIDEHVTIYERYMDIRSKKEEKQKEIKDTKDYVRYNIEKVNLILSNRYFVIHCDDKIVIEPKGMIAMKIQEVHCLVMTDMLKRSNNFMDMSHVELAGYFSIFADIRVPDSVQSPKPVSVYSETVVQMAQTTKELLDKYYDLEMQHDIWTGSDYSISYDIMDYVMSWSSSTSEIECKSILQSMCSEKEIFLGEFIKAVLKINSIAAEIQVIAEHSLLDLSLVDKMKKINESTLKFIATNNSLYV